MKARVAGVFDRASDSYDRVDVDYFGVFGQRLVEIAKIAPGERVLDVGCGRGAALFPAARAVGPTGNVIGIDLAPGMVARTRAEAAEQGLSRVTVRVGDATDHEYDAVLSAFVLFFLPDLKPVLRRYLDALRPGGRVAISWWGEDDPRWGRFSKPLGRTYRTTMQFPTTELRRQTQRLSWTGCAKRTAPSLGARRCATRSPERPVSKIGPQQIRRQ